MSDSHPLTGDFLRGRLRHAMTARECDILEDLMDAPRDLDDGEALLTRGDVLDVSTMLVEGFMIRTIEKGGERQIVAVHVPGDFVDLHAFALKRLDHNVIALGPATIATVGHARLEALMAAEPELARILWFSTLLDAAIHREWISQMGHLRADARMAHIFAELWRRLEFIGRAKENGFASPLRQQDLADMVGATSIYVSRVLRSLREADIAEFRSGRLYAKDRRKLEGFGQFDADYLYGEGELHLAGALRGK